jgi:hypothetical protein
MTRRASPRNTGSRLILAVVAVLIVGAGSWWGTSFTDGEVAGDENGTTSDTAPGAAPGTAPGTEQGTAPDAAPGVAAPPTGAVTYSDRTAVEVLASLPVKGKAPRTGYDREGNFGNAWLDVDHNGCDTRNDVLARDLVNITMDGSCTVLTGTIQEPYTGSTIDFVRGRDTSALLQIDHVVALSNAWQTGAQQLGADQRVRLANDPLNLLAVDGASNSQKGDGDTATWLPKSKAYRCAYVARQISVKASYGLWVTQAEHNAMAGILDSCPAERALVSTLPPGS